MNASSSATPTSRDTLFRDVLQYIEDCRVLLQKGELVELSGLDRTIAALCTEVAGLGPSERTRYADHIELLFNELSQLGEDLKATHGALTAQMSAIDNYRKASIAYRTSDASDNFGKRAKKDEK
jgi:hypothetical protein